MEERGAKTSETHPILVDWLPALWPGRVGLTFAPGKKDPYSAGGAWSRDLRTDLLRLRDVYGVRRLVCLLEDHELELLEIRDLPAVSSEIGIALDRMPIVDVSVPGDREAVRELVGRITTRAQAGEHVVIHCRGGLGRSGTIGGCVLVAAGLSPRDALAALRQARGPRCPETDAQRAYIETFRPPEAFPPGEGS